MLDQKNFARPAELTAYMYMPLSRANAPFDKYTDLFVKPWSNGFTLHNTPH